jgi:serine protease Do
MQLNKILACALSIVVAVTLVQTPSSAEISPEVRETLGQLQKFSDAFAAIAAEVQPAVVTISSEKVIKARNPQTGMPFDHPMFRPFRGPQRPNGQERRQEGTGSGVIVSKDGYILTNNHVVEGADKIQVELTDRRSFSAKIVGTDPQSDVAVLQIEATDLPTVAFGDSDAIKVGEWVLALGNPFGLQHTVTYGIVSAKGRGNLDLADYEDFIQTDAAINPGNSGGAMVNLNGELIGINTAIVSRSGGYQGIGFAIPINMARGIMTQLIETGQVSRGYLGVSIQNIDEEMAEGLGVDARKGVVVGEVQPGTAAEKAGIKNGDVIIKLDGEAVEDVAGLRNRISQTPPGTTVSLIVVRQGREKTYKIKLGELDSEATAAAPAAQIKEKLGWEVQALTDEIAGKLGYEGYGGVVISEVRSGSVGARKGLRRGDLIVEVSQQPVTTVGEYSSAVGKVSPGEVLLLVVRRRTQSFFVAIRMPE